MSLKFRLLQDLSTQVSEAGPTLSRKNPRPPTDAGSAHQVSSLAMWQGAPTWVRPPKPGSEDKRQPPSPSPRRPFACPGRGFALTLLCAPSALVEHFPCYPGLRSGGRAAPPQPWAGLFQACRRLAKVGEGWDVQRFWGAFRAQSDSGALGGRTLTLHHRTLRISFAARFGATATPMGLTAPKLSAARQTGVLLL